MVQHIIGLITMPKCAKHTVAALIMILLTVVSQPCKADGILCSSQKIYSIYKTPFAAFGVDCHRNYGLCC